MPVSTFVTVTAASGTAAPDVSKTVPRIDPSVPVWAKAKSAKSAKSREAAATTVKRANLMLPFRKKLGFKLMQPESRVKGTVSSEGRNVSSKHHQNSEIG